MPEICHNSTTFTCFLHTHNYNIAQKNSDVEIYVTI